MSIEYCRECRQPIDPEDMREDICRWCLAYELTMNTCEDSSDYSQRLADGFDMLDDDYLAQGDANRDLEEILHILSPEDYFGDID
jgi:hypothetical protein